MRKIIKFTVVINMMFWCLDCGSKFEEQDSEKLDKKIIGTWRNLSPKASSDDSVLTFYQNGTLEIVSWACDGGVRALKNEKDGSISGVAKITEDGAPYYVDKSLYFLNDRRIKIENTEGEISNISFFFDGDILVLSISGKKIRLKKIHIKDYRKLRSPMDCRSD